jgi:hypothetical protein
MSEPERAACYLTDFGDYDPDHLKRRYNKASLHAIDCIFMQVRRRRSILEHPIASASSGGRTWFGYSAYNPVTIVKMFGIFRVFYNYCLAGQDGKTPAMRLGLAKGKVALEDIKNSVDLIDSSETVVPQGFPRFTFNCSAVEWVSQKPLQHKAFRVPGHFNCVFY